MTDNIKITRQIRTESEMSGKARISMHDNVDICDDCCTCAAEPYWIEAMQENNHEELEKEDK